MITIITKWYCPYCHAAMRILDNIGVEYKNIDITLKPKLYKEIKNITSFNTVPQVFIWDIHGKFLWGFNEINDLYRSGELVKMIANKKA